MGTKLLRQQSRGRSLTSNLHQSADKNKTTESKHGRNNSSEEKRLLHQQMLQTQANDYRLNRGEFCWDPSNSSKEVHFSQDYRHAFLLESNYLFRSIVGSRPFMDGSHYWEIVADARTEHELKIGVTL